MKVAYFIAIIAAISGVLADISNKYCGKDNCYDILGVKSSASIEDIKQSFRKLSREFHPDKNFHKGIDTHEKYQQIVKAYEVLKDASVRESYDGWLANPQQSEYLLYYKYYKAAYTPQTNPFVVIISTLLFLSFFQYLGRKNMYENALKSVERTDRFKVDVNNLHREQPDRLKEDIRQELLQRIVIEGGYSRLKWKDLILFKVLFAPYNLSIFIYSKLRWFVKYTIKKDPYNEEDQGIITQKLLKIKPIQWTGMDEDSKQELIEKQLWIPDNMKAYRAEMIELHQQRKEQFLSSAKGKKYMRYMKNNK